MLDLLFFFLLWKMAGWKMSLIWMYFTYDRILDKTSCKLCNFTCKTNNFTHPKNHLKQHRKAFDEFMKLNIPVPIVRKATTSKQVCLLDVMGPVKVDVYELFRFLFWKFRLIFHASLYFFSWNFNTLNNTNLQWHVAGSCSDVWRPAIAACSKPAAVACGNQLYRRVVASCCGAWWNSRHGCGHVDKQVRLDDCILYFLQYCAWWLAGCINWQMHGDQLLWCLSVVMSDYVTSHCSSMWKIVAKLWSCFLLCLWRCFMGSPCVICDCLPICSTNTWGATWAIYQ